MATTVPLSKLPPYGFINSEFLEDASTTIPPNFMIDGAPATLVQYRAWVTALAAEIGDVLWPRFDWASGTWQGAAKSKAMALTLADLNLLSCSSPDSTPESMRAARAGRMQTSSRRRTVPMSS
jgi:hypothetical protein